jgi:hypothetical protein
MPPRSRARAGRRPQARGLGKSRGRVRSSWRGGKRRRAVPSSHHGPTVVFSRHGRSRSACRQRPNESLSRGKAKM